MYLYTVKILPRRDPDRSTSARGGEPSATCYVEQRAFPMWRVVVTLAEGDPRVFGREARKDWSATRGKFLSEAEY